MYVSHVSGTADTTPLYTTCQPSEPADTCILAGNDMLALVHYHSSRLTEFRDDLFEDFVLLLRMAFPMSASGRKPPPLPVRFRPILLKNSLSGTGRRILGP